MYKPLKASACTHTHLEQFVFRISTKTVRVNLLEKKKIKMAWGFVFQRTKKRCVCVLPRTYVYVPMFYGTRGPVVNF